MIAKQLHLLLAALILLIGSGSGQQIPAGTVLPVMLSSTLDSNHSHVGDKISSRLMQDVSLASGERIRSGARVEGIVTQSSAPSASAPAALSVNFNRVVTEGRELPITVSLRALASMKDVFDAQLPWNTVDDYGSSVRDWNTVQVGGAAVYRGDGTVRDAMEVVGHTSMYGAVTARLLPSPRRGCPENSAESQTEQSLWVFSPWACGVYGFDDLEIGQNPAVAAPGVIELTASQRVQVRGGSGWLLVVQAPSVAAARSDSH